MRLKKGKANSNKKQLYVSVFEKKCLFAYMLLKRKSPVKRREDAKNHGNEFSDNKYLQ